MDSGRTALLQSAREFGSQAHTLPFSELLNKTITYRTLARYLGIESAWWWEFWHAFSLFSKSLSDESNRRNRKFLFSCEAKKLPHLMEFLMSWFGKDTRIADISINKFFFALSLIFWKRKNKNDADTDPK